MKNLMLGLALIGIFLLGGRMGMNLSDMKHKKITFDCANFVINENNSITLMPIKFEKLYKVGILHSKNATYYHLSGNWLYKTIYNFDKHYKEIIYIFDLNEGEKLERIN